MTFPQEATAILINVASERSQADIGVLLMSIGLGEHDPGTETRAGVYLARPKRLTMAIQAAPSELRNVALKKMTLQVLEATHPAFPANWVEDLTAELRSAGIALHSKVVEIEPAPGYSKRTPPATMTKWSIGPLGANETPITVQAGQLESLLIANSLPVAASHYAQAFESFKSGSLEASNGQLRAALEDTLVELTQLATGWAGNGGGSAIDTLNGKNYFEPGEHDYFRGLWKISHGEGSHPGLSTQAEAEFRFHAVTSAIYFLIHRLA